MIEKTKHETTQNEGFAEAMKRAFGKTEQLPVYEVQEVKTFYDKNRLTEVIVLWKSNPTKVKATCLNSSSKSYFLELKGDEALTEDFIQRICAYGRYISDEQKQKHFGYVKNWER